MERITTEEVMDKLDMLQAIFLELDEFGWWNLEIISADAGTQFNSTEFQDECKTRGVRFTFSAPEHQEMNGQFEMTRRMLSTIAHKLMVHAQFSEDSIHFQLMYTANNILPVLPIKDLINKDSKTTM